MLRGANIDVLTDDPALIISQLNRLHAAGGKLIRWGFANDARAMSKWTIAEYRQWLLNRLWVFDQCYQTLYDNQQPVILTFGHPVGGFDGKRWRFWYDQELMAAHLDFCEEVGNRYRNNPTVLAIAPANEPSPPKSNALVEFFKKLIGRKNSELVSFYQAAVGRIRYGGFEKHIVISHCYDRCDDMGSVPYFGPDAFLYEFHYYEPHLVLDVNGRSYKFSRDKVVSEIKSVRKFKKNHPGAQILVGEFGCRRESGHGQNQVPFIDTAYLVWNQEGYLWCVHSESYDPNMVFKITNEDLYQRLWR